MRLEVRPPSLPPPSFSSRELETILADSHLGTGMVALAKIVQLMREAGHNLQPIDPFVSQVRLVTRMAVRRPRSLRRVGDES